MITYAAAAHSGGVAHDVFPGDDDFPGNFVTRVWYLVEVMVYPWFVVHTVTYRTLALTCTLLEPALKSVL